MKVSNEDMKRMYETLVRIRKFESMAVDLFAEGKIPGFLHSYLGEEAIATGVCENLRKDAFITRTHRGHGHIIAKGGETKYMMAELYGRTTGYCKGKGGSMHIADRDLGILGANGIVGAGQDIAVGAGLSIAYRGTDQVTACFFGDGATNQGTFNEALNLASVWKLPIVFVCENNQFGISMSQSRHQAIKDIADRAVSYGFPGLAVDGNDVMAVYEVAKEAVARARKGQAPR
jgi:pyruvate dehydrogenase E1 component alpha subunit